MLDCDSKILIALTKSHWFILLLEKVNLASIVLIFETTLNGFKIFNLGRELLVLLIFFLDRFTAFFDLKLHLLNHLLELDDLGSEPVSFVLLLHLNGRD